MQHPKEKILVVVVHATTTHGRIFPSQRISQEKGGGRWRHNHQGRMRIKMRELKRLKFFCIFCIGQEVILGILLHDRLPFGTDIGKERGKERPKNVDIIQLHDSQFSR